MPAETVKASRIQALDSVRGMALLGILILNISGFALPRAGYMNPTYLGVPSFSDAAVWSVLNVTAQGSFLAMFALLFGASLALLRQRSATQSVSFGMASDAGLFSRRLAVGRGHSVDLCRCWYGCGHRYAVFLVTSRNASYRDCFVCHWPAADVMDGDTG